MSDATANITRRQLLQLAGGAAALGAAATPALIAALDESDATLRQAALAALG